MYKDLMRRLTDLERIFSNQPAFQGTPKALHCRPSCRILVADRGLSVAIGSKEPLPCDSRFPRQENK
jgi:hypothetical protein